MIYHPYAVVPTEATYPSTLTIVGNHWIFYPNRREQMSNVNQPPDLGSIRFLTGPLMGQTFQLNKPIITIGRDKSNDIFVHDPKVSRYHARLLWNNGSWGIEKLSQTSTIAVNQRRIEQSVIYHNNIVGLGEDSSFLFLFPLSEVNTQVEGTQYM